MRLSPDFSHSLLNRFFASVLALPLLSAPSLASENWFEIELVIFERHGETSRETWRFDAPNIDTSKAFDLEMARLMPTYPSCPQLEQSEIQQVIDDEQLSPLGDDGLFEQRQVRSQRQVCRLF